MSRKQEFAVSKAHYAFTILKMHENVKSPIINTKIVESKWQDNMINYASLSIILPNMKANRPMTSEKLHSQSEEGGTNRQTKKPKKLQ